ncbi:MAG: LL-diaminopimelate aminotransferase [Chloroflexota bacterium]
MTPPIARRLTAMPPYAFAALTQRIAALKAQGRDVIRLDIGSPDLPPAPFIIEALSRSAARADRHGYGPYGGIPELHQAIAGYYARRFGVELAPGRETLALIGSKEGIFNIALAYVDPGDVVLVPDPGYPTYSMGALLAGGEVYPLPLREENDFLPDLEAVPAEVLRRAKLLWLSYPNNPTTGLAPLAFFEQAVDFARRHNVLLCHDNPYADVTFDGYVAPSILQVPGAKEVAVEFNSLSKLYNMGGWRVGMVVGNAEALGHLARLKSNIDTALFISIQEAAVAALNGDQSWLQARNAVYRERRDIVIEGLRAAGLAARVPQATMYVWARIPDGQTSAGFASRLLEDTGVSLTPGTVFGACGEGYIRISLGIATERIREAMERLRAWMAQPLTQAATAGKPSHSK